VKNVPNAFCNTDFIKKEVDCQIQINAGSLTENSFISIQKMNASNQTHFQIKSTSSVLINPMTLSLKLNKVIEKHKSKLIMMCNQSSIGGIYENSWLTADTKIFGTFNYTYDTIAPNITLVKSRKKINLINSISYKINDNLSGIKDYNLYINNKWTIAEYDEKNELLTCYFNEQTPIGKLTLKLEVTDKVNNTNTFKTSIER
jgi:hypothetical protein